MTHKFSITKLEVARKNPVAFANELKNTGIARNEIMRAGKFSMWKNAAYNYHKMNNLDLAKKYLSTALSKFKTLRGKQHKIDEYLDDLKKYVDSHHDYDYQFIEAKKRIKINLSNNLLISGEVPIINMLTDGGFALYFFEKEYKNWEDELRFPLLQNHFAKIVFGCNLSNIDVGIYCIETSQHHSKSFSKKSISDALDEVQNISDAISKLL